MYKIKNYRRIAFHVGLMSGATCAFLGVFIAFLAASEIVWVIASGLIGFAAGMSSGEQLTNLFLLTQSKRELINAEIARSGPRLFDLVMSRKMVIGPAVDSFATRTYITEPTFNPAQALEQKDLGAAIRFGNYSSSELAILQYISDNISSIGHRVGYTLVACGHHGTSVEYYAVNREEIASIAQ